tara:strand:- start:4441 stop:4686 length:246 start_codon:yes stop_codon:yes gene_type:complete
MLNQYINMIVEKAKINGYSDNEISQIIGISRMTLHRWRTNPEPIDWDKLYNLCDKIAPLTGDNVDVLFTNGLAAIRNHYIK